MNTLNNFFNSAATSLSLTAIGLLTIFNTDEAQAIDKLILATGNDIENAFGEMPSYGRNFDITTGREFDASSLTEANNAAGGDSTLTSFLNEMESKDFSKLPLKDLNERLTSLRGRIVEFKSTADGSQKARITELILAIKSWINVANLKAESDAKIATKEGNIAKIDKGKEATEGNIAKIDKGKEATEGNIAKIDKEQEALDKELATEEAKLKIVKTNSNPPE
jgi:hypothetical protein